MIDINLNYQIALFGNFQEISPSHEIIMYFLNEFTEKKLVPSTFQEISNNIVSERLTLSNENRSWLIDFSSNRIDINKICSNINVTNIGKVQDFVDDSIEIVKTIEKKFNKKYNRLSLNTRYLLKEIDQENLDRIYSKLNNPINYYIDKNISDLENKVVTIQPILIDNNLEDCNIISRVKRTIGNHLIDNKQSQIDRVEINFDLNTHQNNKEFRFDNNSVKSFLIEIAKLENQLKSEYLKILMK